MYGDDPDHVSYYYGNYDALHGSIRIPDKLIQEAPPFPGWQRDFLSWHPSLWKDHAKGIPCLEPEKNAYHIRFLAKLMREEGAWIGDPTAKHYPLTVNYGTRGVIDGSHRIRAWRYLALVEGLVLPVPLSCSLRHWRQRCEEGLPPWSDKDAPPPAWYSRLARQPG